VGKAAEVKKDYHVVGEEGEMEVEGDKKSRKIKKERGFR